MFKKISIMFVVSLLFTSLLTGCNPKADFEPDEQDNKIAEYANQDKYISVNELNSIVEDEDVKIFGVIDTTNVTVKNIEGAYLVWRDDYSGSGSSEALNEEISGVRKDKSAMEDILSKAGVEEDSKIVIYSSTSHHDAARFAWQIESLGHENVMILDGGINAWTGAGMATGDATRISDISENASDYSAPDYDAELGYASTEMMIEALNNPDEWVVIDTRSEEEATGADAKSGAFGQGSIKGAIHIEWTEAQDEETLLKSLEELEEIYGDFEGKKVIAFCQSGVRSAHTYEVLVNTLGFEDVYNYDGSWIEWSYAASEASSDSVDSDIRDQVISLTENWKDYGKAK